MRRSISGRALAALALVVALALPGSALAAPRQSARQRTPAERAQNAGLFARIWSTWSHLWGGEGTILDPDGRRTQAGTNGSVGASPTGDAGTILDPDGK